MMPQETKAPQSCTNEIAERDDPAVAREPQLDVVPLIALLGDGQEVLAARLDEAHGAAEGAGEHRHQDVLGVDDGLGPEPAADVLGDDAHGVLGQPEVAREHPAQDLGRLRGRPHGDLAEVGVPARGDRPRLHGHAGAAMEAEALAQHDLGAGEGARRVAHVLGEARDHVAARVDARTVGAERVVERGDGGERLVLDAERVERVGGLLRALGDDQGQRLPRVRDDLLGQDLRADRRDQAGVGQEGQPGERGDVGRDEHVDDAGSVPRLAGIDAGRCARGREGCGAPRRGAFPAARRRRRTGHGR